MNITLEPVTIDNFEDIIEMELPPDQAGFVATNAQSVAQAHYYPEFRPLAICLDGKPVGFMLYDVASHDIPGNYGIYRLMVLHAYQNRGIGRRAMEMLLGRLRDQSDVHRITICYKPENHVARAFYASLGFAETGVIEDGDMIAEILLPRH
ncbi:GNAT family N-acetyltransferase [Pseudoduganella buxea]|uniref:GNAT family N-acetyltransferase n=1 Tax=Pseudoduganella buxea TaxID=1949069 RepID=A0A6I3T398_9BURK|nr:GNAT family N-acetyltransferase [Pseudoduganella buxea]MTV55385.1 GNAT family N-acetyltransferase [Pseudoduganella buxea]GGC13717.1 hypothetical protein GCM10011572_38870 [Pseudoduganella buxea]